jgi:murein DD-endopeptidase MepM/ murein hydrolase activator NlpD
LGQDSRTSRTQARRAPSKAAGGVSAADFLAQRADEFARPRRTRSADRALLTRPLWRRSPAIPALVAAVTVWGVADGFHVIATDHAGSVQKTAADVPVDLSALAAYSTAAGGDGSLSSATTGRELVSRDSRRVGPSSTEQAAAGASQAALPARPSLPKVQPGKTVAGLWFRPSAGGMSTCFCMRWGVMHDGIDLAGPLGSPIIATGPGIVLDAGPAEGFGHWIVIQQDNGDVTIYGHMYTVLVSKGEHVQGGQHIADIGADGQSTGPHLHFGVRQGGINGPYIDPVPWLKARGIDVGSYDPNA